MPPTLLPETRSDRAGGQYSFDELGDPLREVTFVVVDLETTGGSAATEAITEIGAVKVRGGVELGEFATLIDPGRSIPPAITVLTGISDAMVMAAPRIEQVLPAFLEFARGAVLVAHNAPFDISFLKAACARMELPWPAPAVVDTVRLARRVLSREEAPSVRLGAIAPLLGARVAPDHRALTDAKATVDVLHALLERVGPLGVQSLGELHQVVRQVSPERRRKRHLAEHLPSAPGVYLFRDATDSVLYVGTATDLRSRVRSYFSAAETRARVRYMVTLAERVDHVQCAHPLEAAIREQRLIAAHQPRYNRRSKQPNKVSWITLTDEAFPRLSLVATARRADGLYFGPFTSRAAAQLVLDALHATLRLRRCSPRIRRSGADGSPCVLAALGRCGAPCAGRESVADYAAHVGDFVDLVAGNLTATDRLLRQLRDRIDVLGLAGRFDEAAVARDRLSALITALDRRQRIGGLTGVAELVAARPDGHGGWDIVVVRHGRLASAGRARVGVPPLPVVDQLVASAETVLPGTGPLPSSSHEEVHTLLRWLDSPGCRLVRTSQGWSAPAGGAGSWLPFVTVAGTARDTAAALSPGDAGRRRGRPASPSRSGGPVPLPGPRPPAGAGTSIAVPAQDHPRSVQR